MTYALHHLRLAATALAAAQKAPPPGPVPQEALDYFRAKKLKPAMSYRDVWKQEHTVAFTVAKVVEEDLLDTVRKSLDRALEQGVPFRQWAAEIRPTLAKSGWLKASNRSVPSRLSVIYDTNLRVARAVGQWQRIQRTKRTRPFLVYEIGPAEKHREAHVALNGLCLPVDDPMWQRAMPPNGYRCHCRVRQVNRREAEEIGIGDSPDNLDEVVDPGFDYNPGASYAERLAKVKGK